MASTGSNPSVYDGRLADGFQLYLDHSNEHKVMREFIDKILPDEFARIGEGKPSLNVLSVGSGGGEIDAHILSVLQFEIPGASISADVVEPSNMLDFVSDHRETIKFFHSLLRERGKILIIDEAVTSGWDILWRAYKEQLCGKSISQYFSMDDVKTTLQELGLKYEEHTLPSSFDITMCFNKDDEMGEKLLDFLTDQVHFHQSLTADIRAGILDLLQNKCSTKKDGRIMFDCTLTALLIHA